MAHSDLVIEEAYTPQSPPSGQPKPSERPSPHLAQRSSQRPSSMPHLGGSSESNKRGVAALEDGTTDIEPAKMPAVAELQEVYADGHVDAVHVMRSTSSEGEAGNPSTSPCRTQNGGEEVAPVQDGAEVQMMESQDVCADDRIVGVRVVRSTVDEVKTPPESRKDDHSTQAEPHCGAKNPKGKDDEKVVSDDATDTSDHNSSVWFLPPRPLRQNPPGQGRHPDEEFFHTVPPSLRADPHRKRAVFRLWPRDPNGKHIELGDNRKGTLSPDGYPWGATLYDFYYVKEFPDVPDSVTVMTGSALREVVEATGELDFAAPEIEWAKSEGKPRVEGAASTAELIKSFDSRLRARRCLLPTLDPQEETEREQDEGQDTEDVTEHTPIEDDFNEEDTKIPSPPTIPVASPFHPNHEPKRWPFTPFENQLPILLQERVPLHLLPQTLYVHDPFHLLTAGEERFSNTSWTSRPDIIRKYKIDLFRIGRWKCEGARKKAEELEEFKAHTLIILRYQRTKEQIKNYDPVIEVPLPPYARRPTKVEESHLYLSPVAKVGKGNHSIVYKGEWELPRYIFMKQEICSLCFKESVDKEIQRLKDIGRWDKMLKAASWGPNGFTGCQPTPGELDEVNDSTNLEMDKEIIEREITCVVPPDANPSKIIEMIDQNNTWDMLMNQREDSPALLDFTRSDDEDKPTNNSHVAVVRINPPFSYESQKSCTHHIFQGPAPRTSMFNVVAKLSLEDDPHLAAEAINYQNFPEHFFEHYNGYTVVSPLIHAIVPVNAIVPQFYGYYIPETSETDTPDEPPYLSPILLLEHCGDPINLEELSVEDQEECLSLVLRFQRANWLHESVAPRNFLVQQGKPTEFPLMRSYKPELSFRLIDFGRSRKYNREDERWWQEWELLCMFGKIARGYGTGLSFKLHRDFVRRFGASEGGAQRAS